MDFRIPLSMFVWIMDTRVYENDVSKELLLRFRISINWVINFIAEHRAKFTYI